MSKTTGIVLAVAGVAVVGAVVYVATRPKVVVQKPSAGVQLGSSLISALVPSAVGAISDYFKPSSSSAPSTSVSNYLADATAASDSETGVVGFGGWD